MRTRCLLSLLAFLLAAPPAAPAAPDLVDQLLARYTHPKAAAGPNALHLVFRSRVEAKDMSEALSCPSNY